MNIAVYSAIFLAVLVALSLVGRIIRRKSGDDMIKPSPEERLSDISTSSVTPPREGAGEATEDDEEQYRYVMDCNFGSVFNVSGLFARDMVSNFRGNIINISSVWGQRGSAMESLYSASKSAIIGYTKALHKELIPQNVKVNCLLPGYVKTDMNAQFDEAEEKEILKRMRQKSALLPTDVSRAVLDILRSGVSGKIITQSTPTIKL